MKDAIAYYRVSTDKQGVTGLGMDAQREAVSRWAASTSHAIVASYTEVESGKRKDRPELDRAIRHCKKGRCVLVVAKLDRLARNARFLLGILECGIDVAFCDLPHVPTGAMGKFLLSTMASVAEMEAGLISERTKAALAAYKARGGTLGGKRSNCAQLPREAVLRGVRASGEKRRREAVDHDSETVGIIMDARAEGLSLSAIADRLNAAGFTTATGVAFGKVQVQRIIKRNGE